MFDESDVLRIHTGKMTLLDGTPVVDKTEAAQQEAKDRLRILVIFARKENLMKSKYILRLPVPVQAHGVTSISPNCRIAASLLSRNRSQSLIPPRSPMARELLRDEAVSTHTGRPKGLKFCRHRHTSEPFKSDLR